MHRLTLSLLAILGCFIYSTCLAEKFPNRNYYPEINVIELIDARAGFESGTYIFVDVRSSTEFNAIRIKDAVNLPYTNAKFTSNLLQLYSENPDKKIVVYCNGITCIKSYKAAEDALYAGMQNVYAFDAGIKSWATTYPAETILNGKQMTDTKQLLEMDNKFNQICLNYEAFKNKSAKENTVVIDARDPMQRKHPLPGMEKALQIPLDKIVKNIINKSNMKDKELFIFDQVGKQVTWLMYYLADNGYSNFYFLDGGATAVLKTQEYR